MEMTLSIFFTILAGAGTFALGQIILRLYIDPLCQFKRVIADIAHALIYHGATLGDAGSGDDEREQAVAAEIRRLSSRLSTEMSLVPSYGGMARVFRLPRRRDVEAAANHLIYLSNGLSNAARRDKNVSRIHSVRKALGIFDDESVSMDRND